eukprot:CAMPEP_0117052704 /NCGR_PEP_ID=MMETSP0472-20121206/36438_1 /TAXON_ID=693140 ORGANISM="Tiarina fusus, Strain LIS" /NCGR_SAMPLE_ID=MMETSP0472 /ASSEMBLY_ACC=CAM_ASM_000603 /LENGTH=397 /DNA_ID=CAMNT_0004767447 /DNA_START=178 /DNA_END=1368 /DNA_ORIENTATION=-
MGKKSKRNRTAKAPHSNNSANDGVEHDRVAPNHRRKDDDEEEEETMENLKFQDPFVDEYIVEDGAEDGDDDEKMETVGTNNTTSTTANSMIQDAAAADVEVIQSWHPLMGENVHNVELEMDPSAYKMYHTLGAEWPSLTFDFLKDDLGDARQRFPHSLQAVIGTQADVPQNNQLSVLKLSDLAKLPQDKGDDDDELLNDDEDDDESSGSEDEDLDLDPILEHYHLPHYGGVNRIRAMPQDSNVVATWSDVGNVYLYDIEHIRSRFASSQGKRAAAASNNNNNSHKPFFTYSGHDGVEGYAMDWSSVNQGHLATGDNDGNIHLWTPEGSKTDYNVVKAYESTAATVSVEDIQWSPTEATVFCAAESGGHVSIYDTRAPHKSMLRHCIHSGTDVNVASW